MEPMTPLDKEFFQRKNLIYLVCIITTNYVCDWKVLPFAQKYYGLAKQIFVKKICETGHSTCLTFECINCIKKFYKSNDIELETIIDTEFLQKIDPDFMIID